MIKVGIVGCGKVAENFHLPCYALLKDEVEVVAVVDTEKKALGHVSSEFGIKNCYPNISEMLKNNSLDLVDITTPGFTHYDICNEAIEAGVNVIVEKPLALSAAQAKNLNHKSQTKNVEVCVMQNYRFRDPFQKLCAMQNSGQLGKLESIRVTHHGLGIFNEPRWMWNEDVSGGVLYELGIHAADIFCWLLSGKKRIIGFNFTYEKSLRLTTSIQTMVKNEKDCVGMLDLKWLSPSNYFHVDITSTTVDANIKLYPDSFSLRQGEWEPLSEATSSLKRVTGYGSAVLRGKARLQSMQPHLRVIAGFISSLKNSTRPPVSISDVLPTLEFLDEIKERINQERKMGETE